MASEHSESGIARDAVLRATFAAAAAGIAMTEVSGRYVMANVAYCAMLGYSEAELAETDLQSLTHPDDLPGNLEHITRLLAGDVDRFTVEKRYLRKDGASIWVRASVSRIDGEDGKPTKLIAVVEDITPRKESDARLQHSEALVQIAGRIANIGGWRVDLLEGRLYWSDEVCAIHEEAPGTQLSLEEGLAYYPPEWRDRIRSLFFACARDGTPFDEEMQIITARGRRVWVRAIGEAVRNDAGEIVTVQGAFQDITQNRVREAALAESEAELSAVFNQSYLFQGILSREGVLLKANTLGLATCGYLPEEVGGKLFWEGPWWSWDARVSDEVRLAVERARAGEVVRMELDYRAANGETHRADFSVSPILDAQGEQTCLLVSGLDISEKDRAKRELERERQFLKAMLENVSEGIVACDAEGRLTVFNRATREFHGLSELPIPPERWSECYSLFHADGRTRMGMDDIPLMRALRGEKVRDVEMIVAPTDLPARRVLCSGQAMLSGSGQRLGAVVVMHDITVTRKAEEDLRQAYRAQRMLSRCNEELIRARSEEELLSAICRVTVEFGGYRMAWVGYAEHDAGRTIRPVAWAGEELGYFSEIALSWHEAVAASRGPAGQTILLGKTMVCEDVTRDARFDAWLEPALHRGYRGVICLPLKHDDKPFGLLGLYAADVVRASGEELGLLEELAANLAFGICSLRSEREKARMHAAVHKMAASVSFSAGEAFFDQLAASMADALGAEGAFIARLVPGDPYIARTVAAVFDGEVVPSFDYALSGTPCEDLIASVECVVAQCVAEQYPESPSLAERRIQSYVGRRLDDQAGRPIGLVYVLYREPLQQTNFITSTLQIFAARAAAELQRQTADVRLREQAALLDKASDAILVRDLDHRIRYWNQGAERLYGWTAQEVLEQSVEMLLYTSPEKFREATRAVLEQGEWQGRIAQRRKDGNEIVVEGHWTLVTDDQGAPVSILAINTDITERVALEDKLLQSQRLESIGQLTGGVAHDFNNLLTVIQGNAELLAERLVEEPRLHMLAEMIGSAAQKGADLTHRLLAVARRQALDPVSVDVNVLLSGMQTLLQRTLSEDIEIRLVEFSGLWRARVDPSELEGAVLNLCLNARDAMRGGGRLIIETANVQFDDRFASRNVEVAPGDYVMVAVSDTGCGIPSENLSRVFDPFFTTKEFGEGTGLGLSMVYGFIRQSRGHVRIYSEVGQGTTVRMYLPRAEAEDLQQGVQGLEEVEPRGSEHILMVEDDDLVRQHVEYQLRELGYRVTAVSNGPDALACIHDLPDIDLLFTDVIMPGGMNGPRLAEAAHRVRPGLRVLYTSGYTENAIVHHGQLDKGVLLLNKPYRRAELARKIRLVLSTTLVPGVPDA